MTTIRRHGPGGSSELTDTWAWLTKPTQMPVRRKRADRFAHRTRAVLTPRQQLVLDAIGDGPTTASALCDATGLSSTALSGVLSSLSARMLVYRVSRGVYARESNT